ncbi:GNAT family N-acetyltransferase [Taibaiella helva]|uniref:GNAT family N-acetyltransferase n=1 Tax=Taibaiella helva TaxID=2301235 RepID=UPI000E595171|nr:GNAT family N-acetyltransferase [Taibaiella helva]
MIDISFHPFPMLTTERLVLRPLEITDDEAIFAHRSDDVVNTYLEQFRHATIEETRAFIYRVQREVAAGKTILWVLTQKDSNEFMGTVCLWNISKEEDKAETGYTLVSRFHGMGYMSEALQKAIDYGFNTLQLSTIEAYTHEHNRSSIALLKKYHFKQGIPQKPVSGNRIFFALNKGRG